MYKNFKYLEIIKTPKMIKDFISVEDLRQTAFNEVVNMINEVGHLKSSSIISMGNYFSQKHEDKELENSIVKEYKRKI